MKKLYTINLSETEIESILSAIPMQIRSLKYWIKFGAKGKEDKAECQRDIKDLIRVERKLIKMLRMNG